TSLNEIKSVLTQKGLSLGQALDRARSLLDVSSESAEWVEMLEHTLDGLELSSRTLKALEKLGLSNIGELVRMSEEELLSYKSIKGGHLEEIKEKLGLHDLRLKGDEKAAE
ncbi:MAG: DNA-directed RNA polymerase subunit alpha C-terminal domain-containing protein, partial [Candidatus Bathyanammoxibius sp.]